MFKTILLFLALIPISAHATVSDVAVPDNGQLAAIAAITDPTVKIPVIIGNQKHILQYDSTSPEGVWIGHYLGNPLCRTLINMGTITHGYICTPNTTLNIESDTTGSYTSDTKLLTPVIAADDTVVSAATVTTAPTLTAVQTTLNALNAAKAQLTADTTVFNTYYFGTYVPAYNAYTAATKLLASNPGRAALVASTNATLNADYPELNTLGTIVTNDRKVVATDTTAYNAAVLAATPTSPTITNTLDVAVLYTGTSSTFGTTGEFPAAQQLEKINTYITASNQAYIDSGINLKLRLVYTKPVNYPETNSNSQALLDLSNTYNGGDHLPGINEPDSVVLDAAETARTVYGADIIILFRPIALSASNMNCGRSWLQMAMGGGVNAELVYGTVMDGSETSSSPNNVLIPAVGTTPAYWQYNGYFCGTNTFTHEIGHLLGLVHDRANANGYGATPYSYAWSNQGVFATIMSYQTPMLMLFSGPNLPTQCSKNPCGYAATDTTRSSDQVGTVNNVTAVPVTNIRPTSITPPLIQ